MKFMTSRETQEHTVKVVPFSEGFYYFYEKAATGFVSYFKISSKEFLYKRFCSDLRHDFLLLKDVNKSTS